MYNDPTGNPFGSYQNPQQDYNNLAGTPATGDPYAPTNAGEQQNSQQMANLAKLLSQGQGGGGAGGSGSGLMSIIGGIAGLAG